MHGQLGEVTHIFYAALQMVGNFFEEIAPNLAMLQNTVEAVERSSRGLRKVVLLEGAKYYGAHLGPYKTPAKESDPRHMPPNFYYDQEDYLVARCSGKSWSWTALRPSCICGFAVGNPMNMATVIAVYASLCKEMGLPLRYPGSNASYGVLMEMTDAELLAKAMVWAAESDRCSGQGFNITNGDFHRWQHLWPRLAEFFKMPYAPPQRFPLTLQVPRLPPDFLSGLVASVNLMRLSSKKAAYVVVVEICVVGNPEFARDDKGEGSVHLSSCYKGLRELYAEREANDPSIHITNCRGRNKSTLCHPERERLRKKLQRAQRDPAPPAE
jgi:nucleoside-diphosphate-sugar epimerase